MRRVLEWHDQGGVWMARTSRAIGGRYRITTRTFPDGVVFDVQRLTSEGSTLGDPAISAAVAMDS
jgi:hypothetical protein